jgi:hypothetical protein
MERFHHMIFEYLSLSYHTKQQQINNNVKQQKYDETMIKLEASTENAIELFTKAEERRERLITKEFVAWQKAQHIHLSKLAQAYQVTSC